MGDLYKKIVLKEILRFYKRITKGVKMEIANKVYVYILSMVRSICELRIHPLFFMPPPPRRWTSIGMGADRWQNDSGPISIDTDPPSPNFFYNLRLLKLRLNNRRLQFSNQLFFTWPGVFRIP